MKGPQRGLSLFAALIIVALAGLALYYAYLGVTGDDEAPSCRSINTDCLKNCRRTRTETLDLQRCQDVCKRDADECERGSQ